MESAILRAAIAESPSRASRGRTAARRKSPWLVYMAVQCCGRAPRVEKRVFPGDRTQVRTQAAQHALRMLQEELKEV